MEIKSVKPKMLNIKTLKPKALNVKTIVKSGPPARIHPL